MEANVTSSPYDSGHLLQLTFRLSQGVEVIQVDNENLLREPLQERFFRVSDASAKLLSMLKDQEKTGTELVSQLADDYSLDTLQIEDTVSKFLRQMLMSQVICTTGELAPMPQLERIPTPHRKPVRPILKLTLFRPKATATRGLPSEPSRLNSSVLVALLLLYAVGALVWILYTLRAYQSVLTKMLGGNTSWIYLSAFLWIIVHLAIHEAAHSLTCRRLGGHIREVGVGLLYYFIPVGYVDLSDAFRLPRRRRAAIAIAGPVTDLLLASITSLVTWFGRSRMQLIAYQVLYFELAMFIFNCNPFMPSDLYKAVENMLGAVGMRTRSFAYLRSLVFRSRLPITTRALSRSKKIGYILYSGTSLLYIATVLTLVLIYYINLIGYFIHKF